MCITLKGAGGEYHFDLAGWYFALELARKHGWEPEGAAPLGAADAVGPAACPEPFAWYAGYLGVAGRQVSYGDARRWADALERALAAVSPTTTAGRASPEPS